MKRIDEDIKARRFAPIYLLYGEEGYLKKQYREKLRRAIAKDGDTMNVSCFAGKGIHPPELIDLAETMPFFAEYRLIIVEDSKLFKNKSDDLAAYMKETAESTIFLFVEEEVDKRGKMYKNVKAAGTIVEFPKQTERILSQWILSRLMKEKKKITQTVMQQFLSTVGSDMWNIDRELEKLLCYTMGKEIIEREDITAVCVPQLTNKIFDMVHAIGEKNRDKALTLYYDLLALKEPPMRILFLIVRQFRILLQIKELSGKGHDHKFIARETGLPEFAVKKHLGQAGHFTMKQLRQAMEDCAASEERVKTGNLNDQMSVELLIVSYSRSSSS